MTTAREVLWGLAGSALAEWDTVAPLLRARTLRKGEFLFHVGEVRPCIFIVTKGWVKMVYETTEGGAWVKAFAGEGTCFASLVALAPGGVTSFSTQAVVESRVEQLDFAQVRRLAARHLEWQRAVSRAFEVYGLRKEKREMELLTLSAEERYQRFLDEHPDLAPLLAQRDIASYIRVTPVALSRIRARMRARRRAS
ncbi:Crp/Fnr family transcriptional regulator [Myxococcus faecalis]|uniref:Crp/Fnr family transcriptional regulator n=1 Tax=Myxococcus faecalis TaxID=3115646 RepID=UPI003CF9F0D1